MSLIWEKEYAELIESWINGNRKYVKTEISCFSRERFIDFTLFLMDEIEFGSISKDDAKCILEGV